MAPTITLGQYQSKDSLASDEEIGVLHGRNVYPLPPKLPYAQIKKAIFFSLFCTATCGFINAVIGYAIGSQAEKAGETFKTIGVIEGITIGGGTGILIGLFFFCLYGAFMVCIAARNREEPRLALLEE
jgi:hypothetical protein